MENKLYVDNVDDIFNGNWRQQLKTKDQFSTSSLPSSSDISFDDIFNGKWRDKMPSNVLPVKSQVTQTFGTQNPIESFSGGRALDTNFAAPENTPVSAPKGDWYVNKVYNQANPQGYVGNGDNSGYGNAVMLQNAKTGEKLHFIHLSNVGVKPGQFIPGGTSLGTTGSSGNATGPNLGVEYYDQKGQLGEVLNSPYGQSFNTNNGK